VAETPRGSQPSTANAEGLRTITKAFTFTPIECRGVGNTHPTALNADRFIVGVCDSDERHQKSFLWSEKSGFQFFQNADFMTIATGVNRMRDVVGFYYVPAKSGRRSHEFIRDPDGRFHTFDPPNSLETYAHALSDSGVVVGAFVDRLRVTRGFRRNQDGSFATIEHPDAFATIPTGVNSNGVVAGYFSVKGVGDRGFTLSSTGGFSILEPDGLQPKSINAIGQLVGLARTGGFLRTPLPSGLAGFEHPACHDSCTIPTGINDKGEVVGQYQVGSRVFGFLAVPRSNLR
jgi:hypothetical protein